MTKTISVHHKQKTDSASNWATNNPILMAGEFGYDSTNGIVKIGDGTTHWNSLPVVGGGATAESIENQNTATGATNPLYNWVGTKNEYETQDIVTNHPDWICLITDDDSSSITVDQTPTKDSNNLVTSGGVFKETNIKTNCITEIPQDINLTLSNGTLTLKAGSKVYVPNGSGVYNTSTISSDITLSQGWGSSDTFLIFVFDNVVIEGLPVNRIVSGASDSISGSDHIWYDTSNNKIKYINSDGTVRNYSSVSLPIAKITGQIPSVTSIDQVFNGFCFVGSTVFVLPGVKGLIPNGRNADGTLKSTAWTTGSVLTTHVNTNYVIGVRSNAAGVSNAYSYDEQKNQNLNSGSFWNVTVIGKTLGDGTIKLNNSTSHAVDYNDTEYIAHQAMPSLKFINMTVGASGSTYTALVDGWLYLYPVFSQDTGSYCHAFVKKDNSGEYYGASSDGYGSLYKPFVLPVSKGMIVKITFEQVSMWGQCRWIFSNGAA